MRGRARTASQETPSDGGALNRYGTLSSDSTMHGIWTMAHRPVTRFVDIGTVDLIRYGPQR
jgi:hypothetical protein